MGKLINKLMILDAVRDLTLSSFSHIVESNCSELKPEKISDEISSQSMRLPFFIELKGKVKTKETMNNFEGVIALIFPKGTYINISEKALMQKVDELDEDALSIGLEMANMVSGGLKSTLEKFGHEFDLMSPVYDNESPLLKYQDDKNSYNVLFFESSFGHFKLEFFYDEK
jgi:CheY-specific phosphatase CheX